MRWFLVLLLFLSSGVFADITCADRKGGITSSFKGRDGYSGKEACNKDNNCIIKLELSGCYGGSGSGNDGAYEWCSYYGTYTGAVCNASVPPLPQPPTENYCDSASTLDTKKNLQSECEAQGGDFVYSCDRDKGAIDWKCNPKKKPDSGSGDGSTDGVISDTKTLWRNCDKGDLYCLAFMHASIDNVSRLIKQQTESNHNDFSSFQSGFDAFNNEFTKANSNLNSINRVLYNIDSTESSVNSFLGVISENVGNSFRSSSKYQESSLKYFESWDSLFNKDSKALNYISSDINDIKNNLSFIQGGIGNTNDILLTQMNLLSEIAHTMPHSGSGSGSGDSLTQKQLYSTLNNLKKKSDKQGNSLKGLLNGQGEALNKTYGDIDKILNGKDNPLQNKVFDNPFENVFKSPQAQCPEFSITMFGETAVIKDHCRALEVLNKFMVIVMWAWCGIALFNDAKEIYLRVTTNS